MKYECHGHIMSDGRGYREAVLRHKDGVDVAAVRLAFENLRACGVGFYRDGGDKFGVSRAAKKIAPEYGIDYRTPVTILYKEGHYGGMYGYPFADLREYRALVARVKAEGADFVKVTVTGMMDFSSGGSVAGPSLTGAELGEMVSIAGGEGFAVMAHCNGGEHMRRALECGVKSIEHGYFPNSESDLAAVFLQTGAIWTPTRAAVQNLLGKGLFDDDTLGAILTAQQKTLQKAAQSGVLTATGSDAGALGVYQGRGCEDEYGYFAELGISPERGNAEIARVFKVN